MAEKLIFFDLDGTLIDGYDYIYSHLWEYFKVDRKLTRSVMQKHLDGKISYDDWVQHDLHLLQKAGATKAKMLQAIGSLYPMKGVRETLTRLKKMGYKIIVVSGGIDLVIQAVFPDYESLFDDIYINKYHFDSSGNLIGATSTKYDLEQKAQCIIDTAERYHMTPAECVFVGDNANDVEAALTAGTSIAFNAKSDRLIEVATNHVNSNNLVDILSVVQ